MNSILENNLLKVEVSSFGAELQSITSKASGYEYLWQGDPAFWKRRSPVLFPIVGALWNGVSRIDGREYKMEQHGFARDMEFKPVADAPEDELLYVLESTPETLEQFPRPFRLEIGYALYETRITVKWRVVNTGPEELCFQIGAHPAFNLPGFDASQPVHGYFAFDATDLITEIIGWNGCVGDVGAYVKLDDVGMLPIKADTFSRDALIFGNSKVHRVSLLDSRRSPVVTLLFSSPYVGLWAPKPDAPFVCIEPWYGRADSVGFGGDFSRRRAVNRLAPGEAFTASYMILIDNL